MKKNPFLISVIVPVYNVEKYLDRCIESIVRQTYRNLEIILVDDGSKDNSAKIMKRWSEKDKRIKLVYHKNNEGLFKARLTGANAANGDYIAFVDSDDFISIDYYGSMVDRAITNNYDIVSSNTVRVDENNQFYIHTLHWNSINSKPVLYDNEVRNTFYNQEGSCYAWHTIWNKIYSKALWKQCEKEYQKIQTHLVMTEDIAFSSILFYFAKSYAHSKGGYYFYCENNDASTNSKNISIKKFSKNLVDIIIVFQFVREFLENQKASAEILSHFQKFQFHYYCMWKHTQETHFPIELFKNSASQLVEKLNPHVEVEMKDFGYFESQHSSWYPELENIKNKIASDKVKVVSFDIFDTLINRPLWNPADLFELIQHELSRICPILEGINFKKIRQLAEDCARKEYCTSHSKAEDVTLEEIYREFAHICGQDYYVVKALELRERELELELSNVRDAGKELFLFAHKCNKRVILTSDMYLERYQIEQMLKKNEYINFDKLFLSSELRLTKYSGHIFEFIVKELQIPANQILHIGDNYEHDFCMSSKKGFQSAFLPKSIDRFCNKIQKQPVYGLCSIGTNTGAALTSFEKQYSSLGYRTFMAVVANRMFDNPFTPWNEGSTFGGNPYYIGYYAVGMHLVGICKWLSDIAKNRKAKHLVFLARDGYLPEKAFSLLRYPLNVTNLELHYVPCSRKSVLPWIIDNESGLFDLPIEYNAHSPQSLLTLLSFCIKPQPQEELLKNVFYAGFEPSKKFASAKDYYSFLSWFRTILFSQDALANAKELVAKYYNKQIPEDSIVFDMGYSGKIPLALSKCLTCKTIFAYVHHNNKSFFETNKQLDILTMYHFVPAYSGWIREILLSERGNACIGLKEKDELVSAILEETNFSYLENFAIDEVFSGALDFVQDVADTFANHEIWSTFEPESVSTPFEGLIQMSSWTDYSVFSTIYSDDEVYGNKAKINMTEFWNWLSNGLKLFDITGNLYSQSTIENLTFEKNKVTKLIIYALCDRKILKEKVKNKLKNYPILLVISRTMYNIMRSAWRKLKKH